jgi:hypothetical protein
MSLRMSPTSIAKADSLRQVVVIVRREIVHAPEIAADAAAVADVTAAGVVADAAVVDAAVVPVAADAVVQAADDTKFSATDLRGFKFKNRRATT